MPVSVVAQLKQMAKENFRSVSQTIEWLIHEHKIRNESAQEYCEKELLRSRLLKSMNNIETKTGFTAYGSIEELIDDIH